MLILKIDESTIKDYLSKKDKMNLHNFMAFNMKSQLEEDDNNNNYNQRNRNNRNNRNNRYNNNRNSKEGKIDEVEALHSKLIQLVKKS